MSHKYGKEAVKSEGCHLPLGASERKDSGNFDLETEPPVPYREPEYLVRFCTYLSSEMFCM